MTTMATPVHKTLHVWENPPGKSTTDAGTGSSRILIIISWEDVLYLVHVLLDTQDDHKRRGRLQTHV